MSYATRADLVARFGEDEVSQRESMLPPGAIDQALADADAELDGYLARRYPLPLSPVPAIVTRLACDVARYRRLGDAATEDARNRYKDALNLLTQIGDGGISLGVTATVGQSANLVEVTSGSPAVFRRRERGGL